MRARQSAFTLMEMLAVLAVIAILLTLAMPSYDSRVTRAQITESTDLIKPFKESISLFHIASKTFPKNNLEAGIPKAELIIGNYLKRVDVVDGAFHFTFGNKAHAKLKDKVLSIRPLVVKGSPESPISWVCGNASIPDGMEASGTNLTNLGNAELPINCF